MKKPVVLCILDGWGVRPEALGNAILEARTPFWDGLMGKWPHTTLDASGGAVGLPEGQMGNSEVGHMTIGAGRIISQALSKMNNAFQDKTFFEHSLLLDLCSQLIREKRSLHLIGLLSKGGVHGHLDHFLALMAFLAKQQLPLWIHGFLDGRDTHPQSALPSLQEVSALVQKYPKHLRFGTLGGRYFGMDRDQRWVRTQKAYQEMVAPSNVQKDPLEAVASFYKKGITDEFIPPFSLLGYPGIKKGDGLMVMTFRSDRTRQILSALLDPCFEKFPRAFPSFSSALSLTDISFEHRHWIRPLFPHETLPKTLGDIISKEGLKQLRISETEKYAHVTFFLNGGHEAPFLGEERILIPSPPVATYDLQPDMAAREITDRLLFEVSQKKYDVIVVNYANADMVGHTGNLAATIKAIETVDACLGKLAQAVLREKGCLLITADHGNAEMMHDPKTGERHTAHTCSMVPCLLVGKKTPLRTGGGLEDIAPTLLNLMEVPVPNVMTGRTLLEPLHDEKVHDDKGFDDKVYGDKGYPPHVEGQKGKKIPSPKNQKKTIQKKILFGKLPLFGAFPFVLLFLLPPPLFAKENTTVQNTTVPSKERVYLDSLLSLEGEDPSQVRREKSEEEQLALQTHLKSLDHAFEALHLDILKKKQDLNGAARAFSSFLGKVYGFSKKSSAALLTRQRPPLSFLYMKIFLHLKMEEFQENAKKMRQQLRDLSLLEKKLLEDQEKYKLLLEEAQKEEKGGPKEEKGIREDAFRQGGDTLHQGKELSKESPSPKESPNSKEKRRKTAPRARVFSSGARIVTGLYEKDSASSATMDPLGLDPLDRVPSGPPGPEIISFVKP